MNTIQLKISEEVIQKFGLEAITARFQREMELEHLKIVGAAIQEAVEAEDLDHDSLFEEARQKAWEENKDRFLKNVAE